jgi:hypothetical protein
MLFDFYINFYISVPQIDRSPSSLGRNGEIEGLEILWVYLSNGNYKRKAKLFVLGSAVSFGKHASKL